jgi:hypothetical protein
MTGQTTHEKTEGSRQAKPPVFIVGAARSGTGLLRNLIRAHPDISIPGESHFIPHFYRAYGDPKDANSAQQLARRILAFSRVKLWRLSLDESQFADCRTYAAVIDRLFRLFAQSEGKTRWGDKTPHYASHIPALVELFPDAQFVHIVRDGRAVSASWVRSSFGPGNSYAAADQWKRRVEDARRAGATLPETQYLEVRYEAVLQSTEATMRGVFAFLGETPPDDIGILNPPATQLEDPRWSGASHTEIVSSNVEKWKRTMPRSERRIVEATAGDLLEELGYPLEEPVRPLPLWKRRMWRLQDRCVHYWRTISHLHTLSDNMKLFVADRLRGLRGSP